MQFHENEFSLWRKALLYMHSGHWV